MKPVKFSFLLLLSLSSCWSGEKTSSNKQPYMLEGHIADTLNNHKIYLVHGDQTDSSDVTSGNFSFHGFVAAQGEQYLLKSDDYKFYKFLWLVPGVITFDKKLDSPPIIKGSFLEQVQDSLDKEINQFQVKIDMLAQSPSDGTGASVAALNSRFMVLQRQIDSVNYSFVRNRPNHPISLELLKTYYAAWGKKKISGAYGALSAFNKESDIGRELLAFIKYNKEIRVGHQFADFNQPDTAGHFVKLSNYTGKVILVDFWASWCVPCRDQNVVLKNLYQQYKSKGLEIVGVSIDDDLKNWKEAVRKDSLTWVNLSAEKSKYNIAALTYGVADLPTNFLIDRNGQIVKQNIPVSELKEHINKLVN